MYVERIDPIPMRGSMLVVSSGMATTSSASGSIVGCAIAEAAMAATSSQAVSVFLIASPPGGTLYTLRRLTNSRAARTIARAPPGGSDGLRERLEVRQGPPAARPSRHRRRRSLARADAHLPRLLEAGRRAVARRALQVQGHRAGLVRDEPRRAAGQAAVSADLVGRARQHARSRHGHGAEALLRTPGRLRRRLLPALHLTRPVSHQQRRRADPPRSLARRESHERRDVRAVQG